MTRPHPMDAPAAADQAPVRVLRIRGVAQSRRPGERRRDLPPVRQQDADRIADKFDAGRLRAKTSDRSGLSRLPGILAGARAAATQDDKLRNGGDKPMTSLARVILCAGLGRSTKSRLANQAGD